jgi:N-acetyl-beta-hexosaminidase
VDPLRAGEAKGPPPEGYELDVSPGFVRIRASDGAGLFYGAESLRQLCRRRSSRTRRP